MANLTGANTIGINVYDWFQYGFDHVVPAAAGTYAYATANGNVVSLAGTDFTYDKTGYPTGGTVTVFQIHDSNGNQVASYVLGGADLAAMAAANFSNIWPILLAGDDTIALGNQADNVSGFAGDDYINGGGGADKLYGGSGNDTVDGGGGNDSIYWFRGEGTDTIDGGSGVDGLRIGVGDDPDQPLEFSADAAGVHVSDPFDPANAVTATDIEVVTFSGDMGPATPGFSVLGTNFTATPDLEQIVFYGYHGDDSLTFLDHSGATKVFAHGGNGRDILEGMAAADTLRGGNGDDLLNGHDGDDFVDAGAGEDVITFDWEQGNDTIDGGSGLDTVVNHGVESPFTLITQIDPIAARGGRGLDVLMDLGVAVSGREPDRPPEQSAALLKNIEAIEVHGQSGDDSLHVANLTGTTMAGGHILFDGGSGDDDLSATDAVTDITYLWRWVEGAGDPGDGLVRFGNTDGNVFHLIDETDDGHDVTLGVGFTDISIWEGASGFGVTPDLRIWDADSLIFDFGGGTDTFDIMVDLAPAYQGDLLIDFGAGAAALFAIAHSGDIEATGGDVYSDFFSGDGDDLLVSGAGHDVLYGGGGVDTIIGGAGQDEIGGQAGNDILTGGADGDRFVFFAGDGTDLITDFEAGPAGFDRLDFQPLAIDLADLAIAQLGADTQITTPGGDIVVLQGVAMADLDPGDFLF